MHGGALIPLTVHDYEAESQEKICRCNEGESCYWCITDCQGCGKDFEEDHISNDCQVCNKFYCDACIYPMQHYDTDSFRICEPCLKKYPHLKGEFSESHYDREMNAESLVEEPEGDDARYHAESFEAESECENCGGRGALFVMLNYTIFVQVV